MLVESERDAQKGRPVCLSDHVCCGGDTGIVEGSVDWGYEGYENVRLPLRSCAEGAVVC